MRGMEDISTWRGFKITSVKRPRNGIMDVVLGKSTLAPIIASRSKGTSMRFLHYRNCDWSIPHSGAFHDYRPHNWKCSQGEAKRAKRWQDWVWTNSCGSCHILYLTWFKLNNIYTYVPCHLLWSFSDMPAIRLLELPQLVADECKIFSEELTWEPNHAHPSGKWPKTCELFHFFK